jgi:FtsP/CotA-like multicopper oxidase with cupredoxin domain
MARLGSAFRAVTDTVADPFSADITGLPEAMRTDITALSDGDTFALRAAPVRKQLDEGVVRMLAYNGSIPGPTLQVSQGSEVTIAVTNEADVETTVHWHGLRLDSRYDGVPYGHHQGVQPPIPVGSSFSYQLRFPDPGIYWYHPHVREDYTQELGLYGTIVVTPSDPDYWAPVNRELVLVLDDILLKRNKIAPFSQTTSNRTAMGRYGNVMLVNGEIAYTLEALRGEVVRLYLTNTANVRPFNVSIPGARMKLVGGDGGRVEREQFVQTVLITPSERAVVDVLFERAGRFWLEHRTPDRAYTLGTVTVQDEPIACSYAEEFFTLRTDLELVARRAQLDADLERAPDKTLALVAVMPGMKHHGGGHHGQGAQHSHVQHHDAIEWEDTMQLHNRMTTPTNMLWKLVDQHTWAENQEIHWSFKLGDRIKLRIENDPNSDHPMQHPFHIHGQRFLVLSRDGVPNDNFVWKDTVLIRTGETVDLLIEMSNPGRWMAHCHIAEHLEGGMMLSFQVHRA